MGNRANVVIYADSFSDENDVAPPTDTSNYVVLYSHWGGRVMAQTLQKAMRRGNERLADSGKLARIIFCGMVRDDIDGIMSFAIGTSIVDWDSPNPVYLLDPNTMTIGVAHPQTPMRPYRELSFDEFLHMSEAELAKFGSTEGVPKPPEKRTAWEHLVQDDEQNR